MRYRARVAARRDSTGTRDAGRSAGLFSPRAAAVACVAAAVAFAALKAAFLAARFSDGNVYAALGDLVLRGRWLYRDVYYSSPPGLPLVHAALVGVAGRSPLAGPAAAMVLSLVDAALLVRIVGWRNGPWPAAAAVLCYLFSFACLGTTDFDSDIHWVTTALLAGLALLRGERAVAAGVAFGVALLFKVHAFVPVAGVLAGLLLRRDLRRAWHAAAGAGAVWIAGCLPFWLVAPREFLAQVFLNNLGRGTGIEKGPLAAFAATHDPWIPLALAAAALVAWKSPRRSELLPIFGALAAWCLFLAAYPDVYYLYLKLAAALAAVLVGAAAALSTRRRAPVAAGLFAIIALWSSVGYVRTQAHAAVVTALDDIVARVRALTPDGGPVYGDSSLAPLVALAADRPIFKDYVDTNVKFFRTGLFDMQRRADEVVEGRVAAVLVRATFQGDPPKLVSVSPVLPVETLLSRCRQDAAFPVADYDSNAVVVWDCSGR